MSTWHELVIEGTASTLRAFVLGFAAGRGVAQSAVFGTDCGLDHVSFGERLQALFVGGSHHVLLAPGALAEPLAAALAAHGAGAGLALTRRRAIDDLGFPITIEAYSPTVVASIRTDLLATLPPGVRLEGFTEREETHGEAQGAELYSPLHEYVYRASGIFVGEPGEILDIQARARGRDFVTIGEIRVGAAPPV